jgi:molybdate transport system permease protein
MRHAFTMLMMVAVAVTMAFLTLPLLAIILRVSPGEMVAQLTSPSALDAMRVTLVTNVAASIIILAVGTPAAYLLATRAFRGRGLIITLMELPLVLPPAVAGIGLLAAFGRTGTLGAELNALGIQVAFTQVAVVLAVTFVAGPFYLRQAIAAFESVDRTLIDAARTLGDSPGRAFRRIALPLAAGGLSAGWALAFARGIGEFGATIIFAGSLQGETQTLPLAIYAQLSEDFDTALAIGGLLIIVSALILLTVKMIPTWNRTTSPPTSIFRAAPSRSGSPSA